MTHVPDPVQPIRDRDDAGHDPKQLSTRFVGLLVALWTANMAGWFISIAAGGALRTAALALAVGGLIGVLWLLGLLILAFLMPASRD